MWRAWANAPWPAPAGTRHVAMRQRCLVASLHFVEFCGSPTSVIEILVSVECRLGEVRSESDAATSCSAALMGRCARLDGSPRGCAIVDYREHLPRCMRSPSCTRQFHDVPHHLARQLCGFRARTVPLFPAKSERQPAARQHGDMRTCFWRRGVGCRSLAQR